MHHEQKKSRPISRVRPARSSVSLRQKGMVEASWNSHEIDLIDWFSCAIDVMTTATLLISGLLWDKVLLDGSGKTIAFAPPMFDRHTADFMHQLQTLNISKSLSVSDRYTASCQITLVPDPTPRIFLYFYQAAITPATRTSRSR